MDFKNIKCHDDGGKLRITFDWPDGVGEVYVNGRMYTLQEYRARSGFVTEKLRGRTVYYISDTEEGHRSCVSFVEKTSITCKIREISGLGYDKRYKNYEVTLSADYPVPADVICYVKNDDGMYCFGEPIMPDAPLVRVVRTVRGEVLHVFVNKEHEMLYGIVLL